jgi:hypothetical protein
MSIQIDDEGKEYEENRQDPENRHNCNLSFLILSLFSVKAGEVRASSVNVLPRSPSPSSGLSFSEI